MSDNIGFHMPFGKEHMQAVTRAYAQEGVEMTPEEVEERGRYMLRRLRGVLDRAGVDTSMAKTDEALFLLIRHTPWLYALVKGGGDDA